MQTLDGTFDSDPRLPDSPPPTPAPPAPPPPPPPRPSRLDRSAILGSRPKTAEVEVEEWGGTLTIRAWSVNTLVEVQARREAMEVNETKQFADFLAYVVQISACDEWGRLLFTEADQSAIAGLGFLSLQRVTLAALKLNGLSNDDDADDGAVAKNS